MGLVFCFFIVFLSTLLAQGVHGLKKMPTAEPFFTAAHLDSPVFNLDDGSLWVSDVQNDRVLRLLDVSPKSDAAKKLAGTKPTTAAGHREKDSVADIMFPPAAIRTPSGRARGIAFDLRGRLVMCESSERRITRLELDGSLTVLVDKFDNKRLNSPDDLVIDSKGRIFFTDPRFGPREDMDMAVEGVYRIDVDEFHNKHRVTRIMDNRYVKRPAGIVLSPDESKMYLVEAHPASPRLVALELKRDGTLVDAPPYVVYDFGKGKGGDGLCIDSHSNLFVAAGSSKEPFNPPGIYAFAPEGTHLGFMPIPEDSVISCRFGGWDMRTLYITAGGCLYQARMAIPGFNANFYPREDEEREVHDWEDEPHPTPAPTPTPCPVDPRCMESEQLRERIAELGREASEKEARLQEAEDALQEALSRESEMVAMRRRRQRARRPPRRSSYYDDYYYEDDYYFDDEYDYAPYDDLDYIDDGYERPRPRRRYMDDLEEDLDYDLAEVGGGSSSSFSRSTEGGSNSRGGSGGGRRAPPVKHRTATRQPKGAPDQQQEEDSSQQQQQQKGAAGEKKADVRQIFRRSDEL